MSNRPLFWTISFAIASLFLVSPAHAVLTWDFDIAADDGLTADGWTDTMGTSIHSGPNGFIPPGGRTAQATPGVQAWDNAHPSLVFSSPLLNITGPGSLLVDLTGGRGHGGSPAGAYPTNLSDIPANSTGAADGWLLLSLRRASDGAYVFNYERPTNSDGWITYNVDLSAFAGDGIGYHLDLIDSLVGGWGHLSIDDVTIDAVLAIPEPATICLLAFAIPILVRVAGTRTPA